MFLKKHNYFKLDDNSKRIGNRFNANDIKTALANSPIYTFEITERCNLNCAYCTYGNMYCDYDPRKKKDLSVKIALQFLLYMKSLWNSQFSTSMDDVKTIGFYGGEPLLNYTFIKEVIKHIKLIWKGVYKFSFQMTTNGTLLDKHLDFLAQNNFELLISLDGNVEHNKYRFGKNYRTIFNQIIRNVSLLKKKYPEYFKKKSEISLGITQ